MTANQISEQTRQIVDRMNEALNEHNVDKLLSLLTDDVVFENTGPAPDGERYVGKADVRKFFESFFRDSPNAFFESEDRFSSDDRCLDRWHYTWDPNGDPGSVRGASVYRIRDAKISEVFAYVKG
jgi:ketosteroid isomerase-like protein